MVVTSVSDVLPCTEILDTPIVKGVDVNTCVEGSTSTDESIVDVIPLEASDSSKDVVENDDKTTEAASPAPPSKEVVAKELESKILSVIKKSDQVYVPSPCPAELVGMHPRTKQYKEWLRLAFVEQAKKYIGVPYAQKFFQPGEELYDSPIFLDCCALVRRVVDDLSPWFGFKLGGGNQCYQFDTLKTVLTKEQMRPGDLIFYTATYNNGMKKQKHDLVHVEIYLGLNDESIGSRWWRGCIQAFESFKFTSTNYHSVTHHFRSLEDWMTGDLKVHCQEHRNDWIHQQGPKDIPRVNTVAFNKLPPAAHHTPFYRQPAKFVPPQRKKSIAAVGNNPPTPAVANNNKVSTPAKSVARAPVAKAVPKARASTPASTPTAQPGGVVAAATPRASSVSRPLPLAARPSSAAAGVRASAVASSSSSSSRAAAPVVKKPSVVSGKPSTPAVKQTPPIKPTISSPSGVGKPPTAPRAPPASPRGLTAANAAPVSVANVPVKFAPPSRTASPSRAPSPVRGASPSRAVNAPTPSVAVARHLPPRPKSSAAPPASPVSAAFAAPVSRVSVSRPSPSPAAAVPKSRPLPTASPRLPPHPTTAAAASASNNNGNSITPLNAQMNTPSVPKRPSWSGAGVSSRAALPPSRKSEVPTPRALPRVPTASTTPRSSNIAHVADNDAKVRAKVPLTPAAVLLAFEPPVDASSEAPPAAAIAPIVNAATAVAAVAAQ